MSDEMFAARHLRYEIYEKKQIQPLLSQRRRSRSNRSESEHSLTASANPCSPDAAGGAGSEAVSKPLLACSTIDEVPPHSEPTVCHLPDQTGLPPVDVRLCRISTCTLAALSQTTLPDSEVGHADPRTVEGDLCKAGSWPERSFPLVDDDYDQLLASASNCDLSTSMPSAPLVSVGSGVPLAEPFMTDSVDQTSNTEQSDEQSIPAVTQFTWLQ